MKEVIKSSPHFKAYSLKALNPPTSSNEHNDRNRQFMRVIRRVRVLPGTGTYLKKTAINKINIPVTVQPADKNWFRNYE